MNSETLKKILQYAPDPPQRVWEGILNSLDGNIREGLAEKMQNYQTAPPEHTWKKIEQKLGASVIAIKSNKKFFNFRRTAAAAAIIIIAAASILFWNLDEIESSEIATKTVVPEQQKTTPSNPPAASVEVEKRHLNDTRVSVALASAEQKTARSRKESIPNRSRLDDYVKKDQPAITSFSFIPNRAQEKAIAVSALPVEKYMVYSDDNGNAMRLPKKLFDLINCVKEELICQQKIQQMQYKLASYITTNDFSGLMEMLRNLKENQ